MAAAMAAAMAVAMAAAMAAANTLVAMMAARAAATVMEEVVAAAPEQPIELPMPHMPQTTWHLAKGAQPATGTARTSRCRVRDDCHPYSAQKDAFGLPNDENNNEMVV